jgi:hypothetical protein
MKGGAQTRSRLFVLVVTLCMIAVVDVTMRHALAAKASASLLLLLLLLSLLSLLLFTGDGKLRHGHILGGRGASNRGVAPKKTSTSNFATRELWSSAVQLH